MRGIVKEYEIQTEKARRLREQCRRDGEPIENGNDQGHITDLQ